MSQDEPRRPDRGHPHGFSHSIRVRYGDCDMQGVVFNATYLSYVDDTVDVWLQQALGASYLDFFEYQVKKAALEWSAPARPRDVIALRPTVTRWGNTSFDVTVGLDVDGRPIATCELVLVSVDPGAAAPAPVPDAVRAALAGPSERA